MAPRRRSLPGAGRRNVGNGWKPGIPLTQSLPRRSGDQPPRERVILSLRTFNPNNRSASKPLLRLRENAREGGINMVGGTNISQFRTLLNDATPEDLVTIAPLLFSRIGTLDQSQQDRFIQEVKSDPQAKRVFEKMQSYTH